MVATRIVMLKGEPADEGAAAAVGAISAFAAATWKMCIRDSNGAYAEMDSTPIRYVNRSYRRDELAGVYRASKAALVTPLRDGMNLVAKEYVAAQNPEDPGVLILSRFAGAARQMKEALSLIHI